MPFQSEKQRRFLWARRPDIAKRWAHEYPKQKKLPMYANDKTPAETNVKEAALAVLNNAITKIVNNKTALTKSVSGRDTKVANSGMVYIDVPESDEPTYAGQEEAKPAEKEDGTQPHSENAKNTGSDPVAAVFGKLAAVLAKPLREMMETQQAQTEARDPRFVPQNMNLRRLSFPSAVIPPPMGMAPPAPQTPAPQARPQQPGNAQPGGPVGGGANPQHNPINAFGPLGAKGQLNGNAAFGVKNSPDSLKAAALNVIYKRAASSGAWTRAEGKSDSGGLNAKGRASLKAQGHDIKAPVTESNPKGERAGRQNSFCARMCGMKQHETGAKTKSDPDSRINKSLRKWNCKCGSALDLAVIAGLEKSAVLDIIGKSLAPVINKLTVARPPATLLQRATQLVTGKAPPVALGTKLKELAMNRVVKPGIVGLGMLGAGHDVANMAMQAPKLNHVTHTINGVAQPSRTLVNGVQVLRNSNQVALNAGQQNMLATVGYKKPMLDLLPGVTSRAQQFNPVQAAQQFASQAQ